MVDLLVWADLDGGVQGNVRQTSLQLGAHHQVVVLVDSFEPLLDAETLITGVEYHLSLPSKHAPCKDDETCKSRFSLSSIRSTRLHLTGQSTRTRPLTDDAEAVLVARLLQGEGPANDSSQGVQQPQGGPQGLVDVTDGHVRPSLVGYHVRVQVVVTELLSLNRVPNKHSAIHFSVHSLWFSWKSRKISWLQQQMRG